MNQICILYIDNVLTQSRTASKKCSSLVNALSLALMITLCFVCRPLVRKTNPHTDHRLPSSHSLRVGIGEKNKKTNPVIVDHYFLWGKNACTAVLLTTGGPTEGGEYYSSTVPHSCYRIFIFYPLSFIRSFVPASFFLFLF